MIAQFQCTEHRRPAAEVGLSVNAVYIARSRLLRRLHQELVGLVD